jgi:hypothetical protein
VPGPSGATLRDQPVWATNLLKRSTQADESSPKHPRLDLGTSAVVEVDDDDDDDDVQGSILQNFGRKPFEQFFSLKFWTQFYRKQHAKIYFTIILGFLKYFKTMQVHEYESEFDQITYSP